MIAPGRQPTRHRGAERSEESLAKSGKKSGSRSRRKPISCDDCFFRRRMLCALELDEPCSTFRPDGPEGLVPPEQPSLLVRPEAGREPTLNAA